VDLASVAHIDSGGMRALVRGHMSVSKQGGRVTLVNVNGNVRRVLHILRLDTVLPVCESIDAVLTGLAGA
jgi:anti-anti-sigma factor